MVRSQKCPRPPLAQKSPQYPSSLIESLSDYSDGLRIEDSMSGYFDVLQQKLQRQKHRQCYVMQLLVIIDSSTISSSSCSVCGDEVLIMGIIP